MHKKSEVPTVHENGFLSYLVTLLEIGSQIQKCHSMFIQVQG